MASDDDSGYRARGFGRDVGVATPHRDVDTRSSSPVERSRAAIVKLERSNDGVHVAINALEKAHATNQPDAWDTARVSLDRARKTAAGRANSCRGRARALPADEAHVAL